MADGDYTELLAILVRLADDREHALDLLDKTLGASGPPITLAGEGMDYARSRVRLWLRPREQPQAAAATGPPKDPARS